MSTIIKDIIRNINILNKKIDNNNNNYEYEFYKIAKEVYKDRIKEEYLIKNNLDNQAKLEYSKFCIWCRAFKNADFSEKNFKEYILKEKIKLNFWVKKKIAELFFNYKFKYNNSTMKWEKEKNKVILQ